mmetsp:Transcript_19064/g.23189  ORF Transcript_19064/g.23189 Transcript_19064/m.23189 type:complete len:101 (-) Transcript_19064:1056-1358(-)
MINFLPDYVCRRFCGHFIPQSQYVFNEDGSLAVDHVLRFESLNDDFSRLMSMYNMSDLNLTKKDNPGILKFTPADLTRLTRNIIYNYAREDFERLGYKYY